MGWADKRCLKEEGFISRKGVEAKEMDQVVVGLRSRLGHYLLSLAGPPA